jgi:RHS repeat-associated protein
VIFDTAYTPFGEAYALSGSADLYFTGQNQDLTNDEYDFPYRQYHAAQGRWVTPDPAGQAAVDPTLPQSWNRYVYVSDNPLVLVDPDGLHWETAAPVTQCYYTSASFAGSVIQFPTNCTVYYTQIWVPDTPPPLSGTGGGEGGGSEGGGQRQPTSSSKKPDWLNSLTSVFGYDQNIPLKSCFVDVFLKSAASNLNPFQPGLGDIVAGGFGVAGSLTYNNALRYAATTPSRIFGTSNLVYPLKSSAFRGLLQRSQILAKAAGWVGLDVALGQAFISEIQASNSGECQ